MASRDRKRVIEAGLREKEIDKRGSEREREREKT